MKEKIKNSFQRVKTHLVENKEAYIVGVGSFVIGVGISYAVGEYVRVNTPGQSGQQVAQQKVVALKAGDVTQNVTQNQIMIQMVRPGPKAFVLQCLETQEIFPSMNQAAKSMGLNRSDLMNHLKGDLPSVKGFTFNKLSEV